MEILSDRFTTSTFQINMSNIENSKGPLWINVVSSKDFRNEHMYHVSNYDIYQIIQAYRLLYDCI